MLKSEQIIQKRRVALIVDDQEINREVLGSILEKDYEILYAADGHEAMEIIRKNADEISIVMLDLLMPGKSGYEALDEMKADEHLRSIPVVVLTAEREAELKALQMGAADFIAKPFDLREVILARVGRIVELSEGRQLISAAEHDKITGLYNRGFFWEYANRLYNYHPELHFDAAVLNIEQFHLLNAVSGREFGDEVLAVLGQEIRKILQETVGIAGRYEADRFNIYCKHREDYPAVLARLQKKVDTISPKVSIHLRMGVMPWQADMNPISLFDHAKTACSLVRGNYHHPLMIYNKDMRDRELLDRRLLNDLTPALEEGQFVVYYQPKYNIQCDPPRLASAEALIRWKHPELGMVSPGLFIPLFEKNGAIGYVDHFVWERAAKQVAAWKQKYHFTLPISVNVSRADMVDVTLADRLKNLIVENGLEYGDLKLEITESAYIDNADTLIEQINELRSLNFEVEMDDFGSGYSSLNTLSSMPVDVLKMDMKFIRKIEISETDRKLVTLILDIAKYMNLTVVAEGVETKGQLEILKNAGCDLVQGFYFSRPLPPEEFEELIQKELEIKRNRKE